MPAVCHANGHRLARGLDGWTLGHQTAKIAGARLSANTATLTIVLPSPAYDLNEVLGGIREVVGPTPPIELLKREGIFRRRNEDRRRCGDLIASHAMEVRLGLRDRRRSAQSQRIRWDIRRGRPESEGKDEKSLGLGRSGDDLRPFGERPRTNCPSGRNRTPAGGANCHRGDAAQRSRRMGPSVEQ